MEGTKERNSKLEDRPVEITQSVQQKENRLQKKNEQSNKALWTITKI